MSFFSVKKEMKIGGKVYLPCICYPISRFIEYTVDKLVEENKAEKYDEYVYFQSGKRLLTEKERKEKIKAEKKAKKEVLKKEQEKTLEVTIDETVDETVGF